MKIAEIENFFIPKIKFLRVKNRKTILILRAGTYARTLSDIDFFAAKFQILSAIPHTDWVLQLMLPTAPRCYFTTTLFYGAIWASPAFGRINYALKFLRFERTNWDSR